MMKTKMRRRGGHGDDEKCRVELTRAVTEPISAFEGISLTICFWHRSGNQSDSHMNCQRFQIVVVWRLHQVSL